MVPCLNPYGYVHNTCNNGNGVDQNRVFERCDELEVCSLKEALNGMRFTFAIDFHEDWAANGFNLYEEEREKNWIGPEIVNRGRDIGKIDGDASESDVVTTEGVFRIAPTCGESSIGGSNPLEIVSPFEALECPFGCISDVPSLTANPHESRLPKPSSAVLRRRSLFWSSDKGSPGGRGTPQSIPRRPPMTTFMAAK